MIAAHTPSTGQTAFYDALITRPDVVPANLQWTKLESAEQLKELVSASTASGKPVAVKVTAKWCTNCHIYDDIILDSQKLKLGFSKLTRLKIDVTLKEDRARTNEMRDALGIPHGAQPYIVFIDAKGNIRRGADIRKMEEEPEKELQERLDLLLGGAEAPATTTTASTTSD